MTLILPLIRRLDEKSNKVTDSPLIKVKTIRRGGREGLQIVLKMVSMLIKIIFTYLKNIFVLAHTLPFSIHMLIPTER